DDDALAKAGTILIKFAPGELNVPTRYNGDTLISTQNWTIDNIVAYSKICTHVGCPVALYEQTTHHILCPCHQSTFDAATGATVIFGPAPRPLPQLPLMLDSDGYLAAASDYTQPVGPSFWERG
ncbi:MAG: Rieske (2Fe-2S) protein, partial [Streptosporangiaceae bacterium]